MKLYDFQIVAESVFCPDSTARERIVRRLSPVTDAIVRELDRMGPPSASVSKVVIELRPVSWDESSSEPFEDDGIAFVRVKASESALEGDEAGFRLEVARIIRRGEAVATAAIPRMPAGVLSKIAGDILTRDRIHYRYPVFTKDFKRAKMKVRVLSSLSPSGSEVELQILHDNGQELLTTVVARFDKPIATEYWFHVTDAVLESQEIVLRGRDKRELRRVQLPDRLLGA